MKLIPLSQGQFAQVDDDMYPLLIHWKWFAVYSKQNDTYYAVRGSYINGRQHRISIKMHRFILGLTDPKIEVDHVNHDGLCNLQSNIRTANRYEQMWNTRSRKNTTSTFKGVCWDSQRSKWLCQIKIDYQNKFIGRFNTEVDAAKAYDAKAKELFGDFANLNFKGVEKAVV